MKDLRIRQASIEDAEIIRRIYEPYCLDSIITFEEKAPSLSEMAERIETMGSTLPWLVGYPSGQNQVLGYAYAGKHRQRRGYQWSVETSVYLGPDAKRIGLGRLLYRTLFELLKAQGLINAYAGIALPNNASVEFHKNMGFKHFATYEKVGYKKKQWVDVSWWHRDLNPFPKGDPEAPLPLSKVDIDTIINTTVND